jgi:hypothetical protein
MVFKGTVPVDFTFGGDRWTKLFEELDLKEKE